MPKSWLVLGGLALLVVIIYVVRGYRQAGAQSGLVPVATTTSPDTGDEMVLAHLQKAGSDLTKPHEIEFFIYLPTEAAARQAADRIQKLGFSSRIEQPIPKDPRFLCFATKSMIPDVEALKKIRAEFTAIAESLGGEYDGWGTPTVK